MGQRRNTRASRGVSSRMSRDLTLQVGIVRTELKLGMGDVYSGILGLKHDVPLARDVLTFYDNILTCTTTDLSKKWFKHMIPTLALLCGDDSVAEFGPDGELTTVGWTCVSRMIIYKEG